MVPDFGLVTRIISESLASKCFWQVKIPCSSACVCQRPWNWYIWLTNQPFSLGREEIRSFVSYVRFSSLKYSGTDDDDDDIAESNLKKVLETMRCFFLSSIWVMLVCFYNKIVLNEKFALQVNSSILYLGTRVSKCPCLDGHFSYLYFCR